MEITEKLGRTWAEALNARSWPGVAEPFLVVVRIKSPYEDAGPFTLAAATVGSERVAAFRQSIASRAAPSHALPRAARTERDALASLFEQRGLGQLAAPLADAARPGIRLVPGDDPARSRLGGPGLLPSGEEWPHADGDRPLTFLAGIALDELPDVGLLPDSGWLLFFADLNNDEALGLIEPATNTPGAPGRVFYVAPGADPASAAPPEGLRDVLLEQRVEGRAQLTLPDDYEVGERLGLDPAELSVYEDVANQLRLGDKPGQSAGDHWVLGAVTGAQGHPTEPDTVLLLHLSNDGALGFEFLDAGVIQFRISEAALRTRDWNSIIIEPDSG